MSLYADRIKRLETENAFKIGPHIKIVEDLLQQQTSDRKVIKLNLGEPDFNIPQCMKDELKRQIDLNNTHYCDPKGLLSLRQAIANQLFITRNLTISPECIVIFPGAKPSIGFCQEVYCNPGDEIIYPSPGFPIYESFIRYVGALPKPLHLKEENNFTITAEQLEALLSPKTKLIYLNFPSNPTGGVASQENLERLANVILKKCNKNVRIYSDEIYENIIFEGHKHVSIASIPDMRDRTIVSSGFSKTFAWTGGRVGYAVFPTVEEANVFKNLNINYFSCVPPYNQEAARVALEHPEAKAAIASMVTTLEERRNVTIELLNKIPGVHCQIPQGAFYAFPNIGQALDNLGVLAAFKKLNADLQTKTSPTTLFQMFALYHHHVAILDRRSFCKIGSENEHYIRISTAADIDVIKEGIKRLKEALEDKTGFQAFMTSAQNLY